MQLQGFTPIPANATLGGAPIDAFQATAFRENDVLFEQLAQAILASPLVPNGVDGDVPAAGNSLLVYRLYNANTLTVSSNIDFLSTAGPPSRYRLPLIWLARDKITISATIDARGNGAFNSGTAGSEIGDFGGSGGGSNAAAGAACQLPFLGTQILPGGASGNPGLDVTDAGHQAQQWASRSLVNLPFCKGGAAGGGSNGGSGGGVIFLCAPTIEFQDAGMIDARGEDGAGDDGGGGGGLVVLTARRFVNVNPGTNILVTGGRGPGAGGDGGEGYIWLRQVN